jgi:hypothetical protein
MLVISSSCLNDLCKDPIFAKYLSAGGISELANSRQSREDPHLQLTFYRYIIQRALQYGALIT